MMMATKVAHWQFEEDDTVAILPKTGGVRLGLVSEIYGEINSSDDEDSEDGGRKLKAGEVRVEWYPMGKETAVTVDKALLLDRSFLMGEIVCRRTQPTRIGSVRHVTIQGDFLLLPHCQYVIRNISNERIQFVNKYDDAASSCYIGYENWAGALAASSDRLLLKSEEGYQCWISTNDCIDDLTDCSMKRQENSSYNTRQWYDGEPVRCTFKSLEDAEWLPDHKPPDAFLRKMKCCSRKIRFTVLKVEPEFINVRWIAAVGGPGASVHPPPSAISGVDLEKVRKLDHFEYQATQIGDRIWVEIGASDTVLPHSEWKRQLRHELERCQRKSLVADVGRAAGVTATDTDPTTDVASVAETLDTGASRSEGNADGLEASADGTTETTESNEFEQEAMIGLSVGVAFETPSKSHQRLGVSAQRWKNHPSSATISSPQRKTAAACRRRRAMHGRNANALLTRRASNVTSPNVGEKVAAEAIYVRSYLDIMWQDGELEIGVPSTELAYASGDLDDHLFVPGNYVLLHEDNDSKKWPDCGYGVVEKVDSVNRVATVSWYELLTESSDAASKRKFIRKDHVSVYELVSHPDYDYSPGMLLMKMSSAETDDESAPIGQVLHTRADGEVKVKWADGRSGGVYPDEVCRVIGEYQWDEGDLMSDTVDDETATSDGESDSSSWSTISMDSSEEEEDDDDDDDENGNNSGKIGQILPYLSNLRPKDAAGSLTKLLTVLDLLRGNLLSLRRSDADICVRQDMADAFVGLYSTLKRLTRLWFNLDLKTHRYGGDLLTGVRILRAWLKVTKEKEKSDVDNNGVSTHPAKENATNKKEQVDIESQLDSELAVLCQVEEELRLFSGEGDAETGLASVTAAAASSTNDVGLIGFMRKTLRTFVRQVQYHTTNTGMRLRLGSSGLSSNDDDEKVALTQRLLQRGLEPLNENESSVNNDAETHSDKDCVGSSFRTIVNDCAIRCFELNPKHKRALSIVDLSSAAILMITRSIIEQLLRMDKDEERANEWPNAVSAVGPGDEPTREEASGSGQFLTTGDKELEADKGESDNGSKEDGIQAQGTVQAEIDSADVSSALNLHAAEVNEVSQNGVIELKQNSDDDDEAMSIGAANCFELLDKAPASHNFISVTFDPSSMSGRFMKAVRQEIRLLQNSLPPGVFVKAFEDRMDLYSCMLVGPGGTPFMDGLFFFDVNLKPSYPTEPPVFHFWSFSTEQLNPNLYLDGKVCVSLLGTWTGKDSEVWNPGSNLLQVLVSIQGLILNAQPYFNEAGYESKRVHPESAEKSRRYNELALIRSIESLRKISSNPPVVFEKDVRRHLAERGRKLIQTVESWIDGVPCGFPLQPVSQGFALSAKKQLGKLANALEMMGF